MSTVDHGLLLVGGGGHCASCIDVIESMRTWKIAGVVDRIADMGRNILGYKIVGSDDNLPELLEGCSSALVTVGQIESSEVRQRLFRSLNSLGYVLPVIISASANVSRHATIGSGTIVMHRALVNARASVGVNCILNTGCMIEHDVYVGNHCHVSTGALVNGSCIIGDSCFIGSGSVLLNGTSITPGCVIGAGSVVARDVSAAGVYIGNPLRKIR